MKRRLPVLLTVFLFVTLSLVAAELTSTEELVGFDRRRDRRSVPDAAQLSAQKAASRGVRGMKVDFDPLLGSPKWVHSTEDLLTGPEGKGKSVSAATAAKYGQDEDRAVKAFLDEHRALFRHGPEALEADVALKTRDSVADGSGVRSTVWRQKLDGILVYEGVFASHVTKRGELINVSSLFVPDLHGAAKRGTPDRAAAMRTPKVTARRAIEIAAPIIKEQVDEIAAVSEKPEGPEQKQKFQVKPLPGDTVAELVWFPIDANTVRLSWQVELTRRQMNERFRVVVDVQTGEVHLWRKLTVEIQPVSYRVITNDSPRPMRPGWSTPNGTLPALVPSSLVTVSALSSNASPLGWMNDGETSLRGNNVEGRLDRDGDDRADLPRIQASVDGNGHRSFDFPIAPLLHPTNSSLGAAVQLFYWCNYAHDRLYDIGFKEGHGNFQKDNFGRGGTGNDAMIADAQDGSGVNNANYTPAADGTPGRIQMFLFSGPNPPHDGDFDVQVVLHEYVHGMSDRRVGGGIGISQFQTYGLGEGWSDFFAEAMLTRYDHDLDANYPMGGYASYRLNGLQESWYFGIRRYPYSTSTNVSPLMFQDIDPQQYSPYPGIPRSPIANGGASEVHRQGEVWGLMLWELRAALLRRMSLTPETYDAANNFVMRLVADAMDYGPPNPTFVQARDAIISADRVLTAAPNETIGTNYYVIYQAFAKRGLGVGASAPDVTTTSGVVASTRVPDQPPLIVTPDSIAFLGGVGGPFSPTGAVVTVRNTTSAALPWSVSGVPSWLALSATNGTLGAEQQVTITISTNAFHSLPVAAHNATLVFTNHATNYSVTRIVAVTVLPVADPLMIDPISAFTSAGLPGGPFAPQARVYTLEASAPLSWYATNAPVWLTLSKTNGTLADGQFVEVVASINSMAEELEAGLYSAKFKFVNANSGAENELTVSLRVGGENYFVEHFTTNQVDLQNSVLTLTPTADGYSACLEPATGFAVDTTGANQLLGMGDDEYRFVTLQGGNMVPFFGAQTNAFWIGANGNITPDPGFNTNAYTAGLFEFFSRTRIAPLFADLNPAAGGRVLWQQTSNSVVVTWENVPQFDFASANRPSTNNVQLEVFYSGLIRMTWLGLDVISSAGAGLNAPPPATIGISRGTGTPGEFLPTDLSNETDCSPSGRLVISSRVREGDSNLRASILLSTPAPSNILVTISCDNTNEIVLPGTFIIPAGQHAFSFPFAVKDDTLLDGTQVANLVVTFSDRPSDAARVEIEDDETTRIILALPAEAREGSGTISGEAFVMLGAEAGRDLAITLTSSNTTRVSVPASVIVPAGSRIGFFDVEILDDDLLNGTEEVKVVASVEGWQFDHDVIRVTDNEPYTLSISMVPQVAENGGSLPVGGVVTLSAIPVAPVSVSFLSDRPNALFSQASIEIPAGSLSNTFPLFVVDNGTTNAYEQVRISASSPGFLSATGSVTIIDDERPTPPFNPIPSNGAVRVSSLPLLSWQLSPVPPPGSIEFKVYLSTNNEPQAGDYIGSTFNEGNTNRVEFLLPGPLESTTTYYWKVVANRAPYSATGAVWSFTTAPFHHFAVEPVASPQVTGQPFQVSVSARDEFDGPVINFAGTAFLSNSLPRKTVSTIVLTEIDTDADRLEFQNMSDRTIDIAGWQVIVYDWNSWPLPQTLLTLPGPALSKSGETFQVRNLLPRFAPGAYPNFVFPTNVLWNNNASSNQVAVLLRDTLGNIVDFVAAFDADPSQIVVPMTIPSTEWKGSPIPANLDTRLSLQLTGNADPNSAIGWVARAKNFLTNNPGLSVPFTNFVTLPMAALPITNFTSGIGTTTVTIFDEAQSVVLSAHGPGAQAGQGTPFDVIATNDISVAITAPDTLIVHEELLARVAVTNRGGMATGVFVTNRLGAGASFVSAAASQGACTELNGTVVCDIGVMSANSAVSLDIRSRPVVQGLITNMASVARLDGDAYAGNNTAQSVTLAKLPQISINDTNVGEPFLAGSSATMTFTVRLSVRSAATTHVAFATSDGTALSGVDYAATNGFIVFPPGITNQPIAITILDDTLHESNETFAVVLTGATNGLITRATGNGSITDNDVWPLMQVSDVTVQESAAASGAAVFNVSIFPASARVVSVGYTTADNNAVAGTDYEPAYGTLVFQPGVTNLAISASVLGDNVHDPGKSFRLVLSNPNGIQITKATGTCNIVDDDWNELDRLAFETLPSDASVNVPVAVIGTAQTAAGAVFTNFTGPVSFIATDNEGNRTVGTNNVPWNYPLGAGFQDSRLQTIYLASEIGATGQVTALSLHVTNAPGQVLSNFTIRTQPYPLAQFPIGAWIQSGWTTNFQGDVSIVSTGWTTFAFRAPHILNGLSNVLVDISFDNASYSRDGFCSSTIVPAARSLVFRTDGAYGKPLGWSNMTPLVVITNRIVNARFTVGDRVPVSAEATAVSNGFWSASLTFGAGASNMTLRVADEHGHHGIYTGLEVLNDRDGDGMPDGWELANGLNPNDPLDAVLDSDGDGLTNLQEFNAGTDPRVPGSIVKILSAVRATNVMHVTIQSVVGKKYSLETAESLPSGWIPVHTFPSDGTGGPLVISHRDELAPKRFYRVRVLP